MRTPESANISASYEAIGEELNIILNSMAGGRNIALLLAMSEGEIYAPSEIDAIYKESYTYWEDPATRTSRTYASSQLRSADPSVITVLEWDSKAGNLYSLTGFGRERCVPTAARVASICKKYDISPIDLIGYRSTARTHEGLDQPFARLAIYGRLLELDTQKPITIQRLSEITGLDHRVVHNHLPSLLRSGILEGISDNTRKRYPSYKISNFETKLTPESLKESELSKDWSQRKKDLAIWISGNLYGDIITVDQIRKQLEGSKLTDLYFRSNQKTKQNESIAAVLSLFENMGIVEAEEPDESNLRTTHIVLSEIGKNIVTEYINIIGDTIQNNGINRAVGGRIAQERAKDRKFMGWLIGIDVAKGATATREPREVKQSRLLQLLSESPQTTGQLMSETGWKRRAAHNILQQLLEKGQVTFEQDGRESLWRITEQDNTN
ncbi:winged helix-turn-helix transcriptional regulator [Candidatus Saccharibacteria bacterium]|nr:winged helix-turn-helix transcriptional regulator [Candidatus Saccharibacteria bacterium]